MDFKQDLKLQNEVDLSITKGEPLVVFTTHQTDSMFILAFDLRKGGFGRKDIKIEINEDGSRMTISGEKPNLHRGFHKTFIIPEEVDLNKVKARFDPDESRLIIRMPKLVKGVLTGVGIQELKEPTPGNGITSDQQRENHHVDEAINSQSKKQVKSESRAEEDNEEAKKVADKRDNNTTTIIAGSTLFVSLIVILFSFIRSKNESSKKAN